MIFNNPPHTLSISNNPSQQSIVTITTPSQTTLAFIVIIVFYLQHTVAMLDHVLHTVAKSGDLYHI